MVVTALKRLSDGVNRVTEWVLIPLVVFFFAIVFIAVMSRYVFGTPIITSIELTRISFNWACFLAATIAVHGGWHIRVTFLTDRLGPSKQPWVSVLVYGCVLVLAVMMIHYGANMANRVINTRFPALGWSQALLYVSLPISGAIMTIHAIRYLAEAFAALMSARGSAGREP